MQVQFLGATEQVTGSQFLLTTNSGFRVLIECGLSMERSTEGEEATDTAHQGFFSYEPSMLDAVVFTHAHLDHSGNLPNLLSYGYEGKIYCTPPTGELTALLLYDSANLNRKKYDRLRKKQKKNPRQRIDLDGLFFEKQVMDTLERFQYIRFHYRMELSDEVAFTFYPAGHILGAAHVVLEVQEDGQTKTIAFTGDLGRKNYPLLVDPEPLPKVDYLVTETTYGDRLHTDDQPLQIMEAAITQTCIEQPGRLIIPAFSVGRTQAILYTLNRLYEEKGFQRLPVFSDSPLALRSTGVYRKYQQYLSGDAREFQQKHGDIFDFEGLEIVNSLKQSEAVNNYTEPSIIVSSSGMIQGGRIETHIARNLKNSYAHIFMVGYAAPGTFGHELRNHEGSVVFNGKTVDIAAQISHTDAFSGHGDKNDLLALVENQDKTKCKKVFLVHGDLENMHPFKKDLEERGYTVAIPKKGDAFDLPK